jgi:hypothetical protein
MLSNIAFTAGKKVDKHLHFIQSLKRRRQHYIEASTSYQVLEAFMRLNEEVVPLRLKLLDYYNTSHSKEILVLLQELDRIIEDDDQSITDSKNRLDDVINRMTSFLESNHERIANVFKELELLACTRNLSDKKLAILQIKSCLESSSWIPDVLVVLSEVAKVHGSNDLKYFTQDLIYRTRASGKYGPFQIVYRPPPENKVIEAKPTCDQYVENAIRVFDDYLRRLRKYIGYLGHDTNPNVNNYRWYDDFEALTRTSNEALEYFHHLCLYLYSVAMGRADPKADALRCIERMIDEESVKYMLYQKEVHGLNECFRSDRDQMISTSFRFFPELFDFVASWRNEEVFVNYPKEIEASPLIQQLYAKYGTNNLVTILIRIQEHLESEWIRSGLHSDLTIEVINLERIGIIEKRIKYLFADRMSVVYLLQLYRWKNVTRYRERWLMNLDIHEDKDIIMKRIRQQKDVEKAPCIEEIDACTINKWEEKNPDTSTTSKQKIKKQQVRSFRAPLRCRITQPPSNSETSPTYLKDIYAWNDEEIERHKRKGDVMGAVQRKILLARRRFSLYEITKRRKYVSGNLDDSQLAQSTTRLYTFTQQLVHEVEPFVLHMASKALSNNPNLRVKVKETTSSQINAQDPEGVKVYQDAFEKTDQTTSMKEQDIQETIKAQCVRLKDMKKIAIRSTIDIEEILKMLSELKSVRVLDKCKANGLSIIKNSKTLLENIIDLTHQDLIAIRKEVEKSKTSLKNLNDRSVSSPEIVQVFSDATDSSFGSDSKEIEEIQHEDEEEKKHEEELPEIIDIMSTTTVTDDSEMCNIQSIDENDLGFKSDSDDEHQLMDDDENDGGWPIKISPHLMDYHDEADDEEEEKKEDREDDSSTVIKTMQSDKQVIDPITNQSTASAAAEPVPLLAVDIPSESHPLVVIKKESATLPSTNADANL